MNILISVMLLWSFYNVADLIIIEDASNKISFIKLWKCKLDPSSIEKGDGNWSKEFDTAC